MPRLVALVMVAWFALVAPAATLAQASPEALVADLNAFWAGRFTAAGLTYQSPGVVALDAPLTTACGPIDPTWGPGAYCGGDAAIYYSPSWFGQLAAAGSEFGVVTVLAHEWGHHIQLLLGIGWSPTKDYELQADCLAGAYTRDAEGRGLVPAGVVADAVRLAALSGDLGWLPRDAPEHGSGAERAISFMRGYDQGVAGCGIGLA